MQAGKITAKDKFILRMVSFASPSSDSSHRILLSQNIFSRHPWLHGSCRKDFVARQTKPYHARPCLKIALPSAGTIASPNQVAGNREENRSCSGRHAVEKNFHLYRFSLLQILRAHCFY